MTNRRTTALAIVGVLAVVLAACGSSTKTGASSSGSSSDNTFVLSEFTIVAPTNTLHAGSVSFTANNVGGEVHELVIVRAASAASLPMKPDGSVNEDKIAAADKIGEIQQIAARSRQTKTFQLTAGNYVAFCNIVDTMMGSDTTMMGSATTMMGSNTTLMHGSASTTNGMGAGGGHIHFAKGMHVTFTVQ